MMADQFEFGGDFVWRPTPEVVEYANLTRFMRTYGIEDFEQLMKRSTRDVSWFTGALLEFLDIKFYEPYTQVVDLSGGIQRPTWCVGGKLNIVHNMLDKYMGTPMESKTAVVWEGEDKSVVSLTYKELNIQVNKAANALRALGVEKGDAVGLFMPMIPEIIVAALAIVKIGGIITPLFSGYGVSAVATRLEDAGAKVLFTSDGAFRRGKSYSMKSIANKAALSVPTLEHMIVVQRTMEECPMQPGRDTWWTDIVDPQPEEAETERTGAEDVMMVIYTSGTTGRPKGAVHTHCGFPVKSAQDMAFGTDVHSRDLENNLPGDLIYWMTDMGWMMGPWLVFGSLLLGASFFIYEGAPDYPEPDRLWEMVARHRITVLGISPTLVRALIPLGEEMIQSHDLSSVRMFASTGEPWNPDPWMWLFEVVGEGKRPIINYSGGTEISGGIVMGNPLLPLKPCAFSAPCPGIGAEVFNEDGKPVVNEVGELVITTPWIGMTRGFWKDPQRYLDTYWSRWENVWVHGDFAAVDSDGLWYILGRSDDTIKIAGKRLGPAEVESILVSHPDVVEAAAIGVPHEIKGSELVLFVVLKTGVNPDEELKDILRQRVVAEMGKPLSPKEVIFVTDLPKTRNAKVMRRMIRSAYLGEVPGDISSLLNPEAVDEIKAASSQV
jgi:acetyl-CoA synthetase